MSYQALYRKYRPQTFDELMGQEHIKKTLKNQIKSGRVSHAYLFCGTRGTGKTTVAKIFAKAINCESPVFGEPCNSCENCRNISEGRSFNVIEIDAASNNGVDNVREIREEVKYSPTSGKYKVYIIDEVHMLSAGAFNALLKTLEEPPAHAVFILATTDPQKVPPTILSRCQRYDFKRVSSADEVLAMKRYVIEEGAKISEEALFYIARLSDGSMRDALSILDRALSCYADESIGLKDIMDIVGSADESALFEFSDAVFNKNSEKAMSVIDGIFSEGRDIARFAFDIAGHLRNLLIEKSVDEPGNILDTSDESLSGLKEQAKNISRDELIYFIKEFSKLLSDLRYAENKRILLEVLTLKLCAEEADDKEEAVLARLSRLERLIKEKPALVQKPDEEKKAAKKPEIKILPENLQKSGEKDLKEKLSKEAPESAKKAAQEFENIIRLCAAPLRSMLSGSFAKAEQNGDICIYTPKEVNVRFIDARKGEIEDIVSKEYDFKTRIRVIFKETSKRPKPEPSEDAEFESLLKLIDIDGIE